MARWRLVALRRLAGGVSASIAVVAGLLIWSIDAFVAPAYGLDVLYIVLLIAMIPCASKRQIAWMTAGFIALAVLGFVIGQGGTASGEAIARLVIDVAALVLTALLIVSLRGDGRGILLRGLRAKDREAPAKDHERVALMATCRETVSIADEVVQQLTATILGSAACRSWLDRPDPDLTEAHAAIEDSIASARRANELVQRLRQFGRGPSLRTIPLLEPGLDRR